MNLRSTRLRRVVRKYALGRRVAQLALATAERERAALMETDARLRSARDAIALASQPISGKQLAISGEWAMRLEGAMHSLAPSIRTAENDCADSATAAQRASWQEELVRQRIAATLSAEAQQYEARQAYARPGKSGRKAEQQ